MAVYSSTQGNGCFLWCLTVTLKENCTFPWRKNGTAEDTNHRGRFTTTTRKNDLSTKLHISRTAVAFN